MLHLIVNKQFMTEQEEIQAIEDLRSKGWEVILNNTDDIDWDDYYEEDEEEEFTCNCGYCALDSYNDEESW